jgi:ubiquinone/menaquinone biosynthesis C-methylase UbiE
MLAARDYGGKECEISGKSSCDRHNTMPVSPARANATDEDRYSAFWSNYQPGLAEFQAGTSDEVCRRRYRSEPDILEMAQFERWRGRDVLEVGCGIGSDALGFVESGAVYSGIDFSPTAVDIARKRLAACGYKPDVVQADATRLPFSDGSFDLVYSMGVLHHIPDVEKAVEEIERVLRPGGEAIVMLYHARSFNHVITIQALRRPLAPLLLVPGGVTLVSRLTQEPRERVEHYRQRIRGHGFGYLTDNASFVSESTDGPGNPLSRLYTRDSASRLFTRFAHVNVDVRYLNLRRFPLLRDLEGRSIARPLERRIGWHLWVRASRQ